MVRGRKSSWKRKNRRVWRAILNRMRKPDLMSSKYQEVVRSLKGVRVYHAG